MKRFRTISLSALVAIACSAATAGAGDISTKKLQIKDHSDAAKRQVQVFSGDAGVLYSDADSPGTKGMSIHVYSATDDLCVVLPAHAEHWKEKAGKSWKYKNPDTKNQAQIANGKLQVKLRSGVNFSLADDFPQDAVNVQVQFGDAGERFCLRCSAPLARDDDQKLQGKDCAAAACDAESPGCLPTATTTTSTSTTTTTLPPLPGTVLKAVLSQTNGNFNYAMTTGTAGADIACNVAFSGSHACSYTELQAAEAAGDLDRIEDLDGDVVTSFWAIDTGRPEGEQCVSVLGGGGTRWNYATAHIDSKGDKVSLNNGAGTLGPLTENFGCSTQAWVGCCQ